MRPKASSKKTVAKTCTECERQVPVACKTCPCGRAFYSKKIESNTGSGTEDSSAPKTPPPPGTDPGSPGTPRSTSSVDISPGRRRTERVKRERPNYFNALEFVSPTNRRRRTTSASQSSGTEEPQKKKRGRPRTNFKSRDESDSSKSTADKEVDAYANVPIEKVMQYAVVLAEINRKYSLQTFRP